MDKNKVDYGPMGFATRAIKYGEGPDPVTHALNTPIYETTTYAYAPACRRSGKQAASR